MAAGVPVIATRVGWIPELVADGINGLLVEPQAPQAIAIAIHTLACDREALARMSAAGRATIAAGYSIGRLAGELCRCVCRPLRRRERSPDRPCLTRQIAQPRVGAARRCGGGSIACGA